MTAVDWSCWDEQLGKLPDPQLARQAGCSQSAVMARRQRLGIAPADPRPEWTDAEDLKLTLLWGRKGIDVIGRELGRSPGAVRTRAVLFLRLGPVSRGRMTSMEAARYSGWDREALARASRALGINWSNQPVTKPDLVGRRQHCRRLIDAEQVDRMVEWLEEHGGRREGYGRSSVFGPDGAYPACLVCGRSDVEHHSHGRCKACDAKRRRREGLSPSTRAGKEAVAATAWVGLVCKGCGATRDVPPERRKGGVPQYCDDCRASGKGHPPGYRTPRDIERSKQAWTGLVCRACCRTWDVPLADRRGRPPVRCPDCR